MGTKASSTDEWVELYNNTDQDVDLSGWKLKSSDNGPNIIFDEIPILATTTISSHEFYLLERTDDSAIRDISADWYGSFGNGLGNNPNCEILSLYDQNDNLIDQTVCLGNGNWPAGKASPHYISMERFGNNKWADNNLIIYQGKDAENNQIWGTPRAQNSINPPTEIFKQLPFDEFDEITLAIESSPYIVRVNLEVPEGKILNIEPGVVLKFYDLYYGISVSGTLRAVGTGDQKIIFTSNKEDPYPDSWRKIYFSPTSVDSELTNVVVEYAGAEDGQIARSGIRVDQSSIALKDSIIRYNMYAGISLNNSNSLIDNVQFIENEIWCKECHNQFGSYGVEIRGGAPVISNSLFKKNTAGIFIDNLASPIIENNNFEENAKAVYLIKGSPYFSGNQAVNNEINGVFVYTEISQDTVWEADLPYIISSNISVFPDVVFTIKPGAILKFYNEISGISVLGTLKADNVLFTSFSESPYPGSWKKIYFSPTSVDSELTNVVVEYAGAEDGQIARSGIRVDQSSIALKDSIIRYNMYAGISLNNSNSLIDNVQFIENEIWCKECHNQFGSYGVEIRGGAPVISNSLFKKNTAGIFIDNLASPIIENNNFEENAKAVYLIKGSPYFSGNQAVNNEINGVFVYTEISQDTVWEADLPYIISSNISVFPDVVFTIKPGAILKFYNEISGISVLGTLKADNVLFTSFSESPYPGSWKKIYFSPTSADSELTNVIVEYGGAEDGQIGRSGIKVDQSSITLKDSIIKNNVYAGIYLTDSNSLIDNVQFLDNEPHCKDCYNQYGGMGIGISAGAPAIKNSIFKKHKYGINIRDGGAPILENLIFGTGDEANECSIFQENQCINP